MTTPSLPLLRRSQLLLDESLASLVERLTLLNGYETSSTIRSLCKLPAKESLVLPQSHEWLPRMSALTGITIGDLHAATGHNYASILPQSSPRNVSHASYLTRMAYYLNAPERKYFDYEKAARFCPHCLAASQYHRLLWTLTCVHICTEHRLFLTDSCPECRKQIDVADIVRGRCQNCEADLAKAEPQSIDEDNFGLIAQRVIQSWFTGNPLLEEELPWPLPNQPPTVLFQVLADLREWLYSTAPPALIYERLNRSLLKASNARSASGRPASNPSTAGYLSWVAAFRGIADWPQGFYDLLSSWPTEQGLEARQATKAMFGVIFELGVNQRWTEPTYVFMKDAFYDYLVAQHEFSYERYIIPQMHYNSELLKRWEYLTDGEAATLLHLPGCYLNLLRGVARSHLRPIANCDFQNNDFSQEGYFVETSYICRLMDMREVWLPTQTVAVILGASERELLSLVNAGILAAKETTLDDGACSLLFHFGSAQDLLFQHPWKKDHRGEVKLPQEAMPYLFALLSNDNDLVGSAIQRVMQWYQILESLQIYGPSDSLTAESVNTLRNLADTIGLPGEDDTGPTRLQIVKARQKSA